MAYSFLPSETITFNGRTTIADGDALNSGVLLPLSSRDSTILKDCNETYPYVDSVNNTVKTHSASWQNSAISGFSGLTVISTSNHDTWNIAGGQSFSKVLSFTSPQSEYFKCALQNNSVVFSAKDVLNDTSFSSYYKLWWYGINKQHNNLSLIDSVALRHVAATDVVSDHSFAAFTYKNNFTDNSVTMSSISIPVDEKSELHYNASNCSINFGINESCTNSSVNFPVNSHVTPVEMNTNGYFHGDQTKKLVLPSISIFVGGTNKIDYPERQYLQLWVEGYVSEAEHGYQVTSVPCAYLTVEMPAGKKLYYDDIDTGERVEINYNHTEISMTYHQGPLNIAGAKITLPRTVYTLLGKNSQSYQIKVTVELPDGYYFNANQGNYKVTAWTNYVSCVGVDNKSVLLFGGGSAYDCSVAVDDSVAAVSSIALYNSDAESVSIASHYSDASAWSIAAMTSHAHEYSNAYAESTANASSYAHFYGNAVVRSLASFQSTANTDSIALFYSKATDQSIAIKGSTCDGGAHSLAIVRSTANEAGYNIAMCDSVAKSNGYNIALVNSECNWGTHDIAAIHSTAEDTGVALVNSFGKYTSFAAVNSRAGDGASGSLALVNSKAHMGAVYSISICNSTAEDGAYSACSILNSMAEDGAIQSISLCNSLNGHNNSGGFACVNSYARSQYGYSVAFINSTAGSTPGAGGGYAMSMFESDTTASFGTISINHTVTTPVSGVFFWNNCLTATSAGDINGVNLQLVKMHIAPSTLESDKVYITEV